MAITREELKRFSEKYHGQIHLVVGLVVPFLMYGWWGVSLVLVAVSVLGAFLPDVDHLIYLFFYGRETKYAKEAREILLKQGFFKYIEYGKANHKDNTGILSHNLATALLFFVVGDLFYFWGGGLVAVLCMSITGHFVYDMAEDWLFFGKLNGNWWLRFNQSRGDKK